MVHSQPVTAETPELVAAAEWWADCLRGPAVQDNGDAFQSGLATAFSMILKPVEPEVIDRFREEFLRRLVAAYNKSDCWKPENPNWASAVRCVCVDYHPAGALGEAATAAGVTSPDLRFPIKTVMWVDPGEVRVRVGYGGAEVVVYQGQVTPTVA